jgi:uncharacterized protein (TIGR02594 family)
MTQLQQASITPQGRSGFTYQSAINNPERIKQINDQALSMIDFMQSQLGVKNLGLAPAAANIVQNMQQRDVQSAMQDPETGPVIRRAMVLDNAFKNPSIAAAIVQHTDELQSVVKAVTHLKLMGVAGAQSNEPVPTVSQIIDSQTKAQGGHTTGAVNRATVDSLIGLLNTSDPQVAANAARSLYSDPSYFDNARPNERLAIFARLVNPAVTDAVWQAGQHDPQAWAAYQKFTANAFSLVAQQAAIQAQGVATNSWANLRFNPKTYQFEVEHTVPPGTQGALLQNFKPGVSTAPVASLNTAIKMLVPVLQKDGASPEQIAQEIQTLTSQMGVNPGAPKSDFMSSIGQALGRALAPVGRTVGNAAVGTINGMSQPFNGQNEFEAAATAARAARPVAADKQLSFLNDPSFIQVAQKYQGLNERDNAGVISSFIKKSAGISVNPQETPWCAAFVNGVLGAAGVKGTGSLAAKSFLNYGTATTKPSQGDIVVLSRGDRNGPYGHVGFYIGTVSHDGQEYVQILGGNQGNSVSTHEFPVSRVIGYRRPPKAGTTVLPPEWQSNGAQE